MARQVAADVAAVTPGVARPPGWEHDEMTDRHAAYLVTLAEDIREDDVEEILSAVRMVRGVMAVQPVETNLDQQIGQVRADGAWRERIFKLLEDRG